MNMKINKIAWKKYENMLEQVDNIIISPKGQFLEIDYLSHSSYLEDLAEEEFGADYIVLQKLRSQAIQEGEKIYPSTDNIIIAKYGYISVHTSGSGYGWIQLPGELTQEQMDTIHTQYALGKLSDLLYTILTNYKEMRKELDYFYRDEFKNGTYRKWHPFQIDIGYVDEKNSSYRSSLEIENGYFVDIY